MKQSAQLRVVRFIDSKYFLNGGTLSNSGLSISGNGNPIFHGILDSAYHGSVSTPDGNGGFQSTITALAPGMRVMYVAEGSVEEPIPTSQENRIFLLDNELIITDEA